MDKALQTMIDNMPEKTGKNLADWKNLLGKHNFSKHTEAVNYLKKEHGVTHGYANTIVSLSKDESSDSDDLVANQYQGKERLKPIYEALLKVVNKFGNDVEIVPKKGSVSIKTSKQFAIIKPATKTRIDLGLKLKDIKPEGRLEPSGPFGTMCTHRVQLSLVEEVDNEIIDWLKLAYKKSQ
ncbi:DUF4287 domain-containing protein [Aliikangiella marina]|uniref:DUF4287 domain-containing protein n=1 Tax=Aliikangiella marina TaxID=1712262 RepID=A0A545TBW1_9GAMM|nr:DUF4287 domain-containing protein [Aliikangiella marina]TQV74712.1 DUF4287 domain-containing protein [Aliikangiella marina]